MNTIKVVYGGNIPNDYTGIVEYADGGKEWRKNGKYHQENGPAWINLNGYKQWHLDGKIIWSSYDKLDLTNKIILSKSQHPEYPTVHVWKILNKDKVYEQIIIPGMEEYIQE